MIKGTQPLAQSLSHGTSKKAHVISRQRVVRCHAVAAAERPIATKTPGPIIMNGQVLHSLSQERLELVKTLGPYVEQQVSSLRRYAACSGCGRDRSALTAFDTRRCCLC
eukprot:GHRR01006128.1.p1 GENE.GHRR01006128.1~~GHRR01006128.1.p1  ORF type:complete len:109 (+),score=6.54 GHRR01006128.1:316-642(+)